MRWYCVESKSLVGIHSKTVRGRYVWSNAVHLRGHCDYKALPLAEAWLTARSFSRESSRSCSSYSAAVLNDATLNSRHLAEMSVSCFLCIRSCPFTMFSNNICSLCCISSPLYHYWRLCASSLSIDAARCLGKSPSIVPLDCEHTTYRR